MASRGENRGQQAPAVAGDAEHADHMDGIYRYQRYVYDATRKYYLLGRDLLLDELRPPMGGTVLEIGCGTGRNLILAARRYPNAKLYGFDISSVMLETAAANIKRAGFTDRIQLALGDASAFDAEAMFGIGKFDRVFISYALSMIPPWRGVLPLAVDAVAPTGRLHIVDFGQQERLPRWFRSGLRAWLAKFSVEPRADLENELAAVAAERGVSLRFDRLLRGYAEYAVIEKPAAG
jgi:S-adenosylmethionine-diacylgycerolhomoserine-N-methlytransferase